MLEQIKAHVERSESFSFETILSGLIYVKRIPYWQNKGYQVKLIFLKLPSADVAIARVIQRVKEGGMMYQSL